MEVVGGKVGEKSSRLVVLAALELGGGFFNLYNLPISQRQRALMSISWGFILMFITVITIIVLIKVSPLYSFISKFILYQSIR